MKPKLWAPVLALAVLAGFLAGHAVAPLLAPQPLPVIDDYDDHVIRVELMIYKNGELVYYDPDDPAVINLGYIIAELVAPTQGWSITASGGTSYNFIDTAYSADRDGIVVISDDAQGTFNRTMYAVPSGTQSYSANPSVTVSSDANGVYVTISASFTMSSAMNVTWTGLYANWDTSATTGSADAYFLLFADQISPAISLNAGDTLTVVYKIILP